MRAVFCDVCKKAKNRWYVIDVRCDASNPNLNVGDMVNNFGSFEVCADCFDKIKKGICENANKD